MTDESEPVREQQRIRRRIRVRKLLAWISALAAVIGIALAASKALDLGRTQQLIGKSALDVEQEMGAPDQRWTKDAFDCVPHYECRRSPPPEGDVWFYRVGWRGSYVYFGADGTVVSVESNVID